MNRFTRQEQTILCIVLGLFLTGLAVKTWRSAHPPAGLNAGRTPAPGAEHGGP